MDRNYDSKRFDSCVHKELEEEEIPTKISFDYLQEDGNETKNVPHSNSRVNLSEYISKIRCSVVGKEYVIVEKSDEENEDSETDHYIPQKELSRILCDTLKRKKRPKSTTYEEIKQLDDEAKSKKRRNSTKEISTNERMPGKKSFPKNQLPKQHFFKIKSKLSIWKLLFESSRLTDPTSLKSAIEDIYLEKVSSGSVNDVIALLELKEDDSRFNFDLNCVNLNGDTALTIAIKNKDLKMCRMLLRKGVPLEDSLYHAIDENYLDGVKLILKNNPCISSVIKKGSCNFQIGLTPFTLAAIKNNYQMLKLLHNKGHKLKNVLDWKRNFQQAWEFRTLRKLHWIARTSPAYITFSNEMNEDNVLDSCMNLIGELQEKCKIEIELSEFYKNLSLQVETFMCELLDQVQSTLELSILFEYDYIKISPQNDDMLIEELNARPQLKILEKACKLKLFRFVTHANTQLALSYLLHRDTPFMRDSNTVRRYIKRCATGLLYPIWTILHLLAPHTKAGKILKYPTILFDSFTISQILFLMLLLANVVTKSTETAFLGAPPTNIEIVISVWVLSKWEEERTECVKRGCRCYFNDWWNYTDSFILVLFTASFGLRVFDYIEHKDDEPKIFFSDWSSFEPRAISSALLAFFYVITFFRILGLTRTNRILGPLRITLSKMFGDVLQFFAIFSLVWFAFAIGLSELFWYYSDSQNVTGFLENATNCSQLFFTDFGMSLQNLFWTLFGYFDPYQFQKCESSHRFLAVTGLILIGIFHLTMILILLNMLIAMMTKSFEVTSENEETEWRFYRAVIWIRFIKGDFTRPPPMNLLPNFYRLFLNMKRLIKRICTKKSPSFSHVVSESNHQPAKSTGQVESVTIDDRFTDNCSKLTNLLVRRYKFYKLVKNLSIKSVNI